MKTIALFGGSGLTGQNFLDQALAQGYKIKAQARNPEKITQTHPDLEVIAGDVLNPAEVKKVVQGTDIVVSLFGHVKNSPPNLQTEGTRNLVEAMKETGVKRIISLSGGGLPFPEKDRPKIPDHLIRGLMGLFAGKIIADAKKHAEVLKDSGLKWCIVRGPRLTNEPQKGSYRVTWVGVNSGTRLGRADLADFILKVVEDEQYDGLMPFVTY